MDYNYQKEFPRPFTNAVIDILTTKPSKALDWCNDSLYKEFKDAVVDKLNGEPIDFAGRFFVGPAFVDSSKQINDFDDGIFKQRASAKNCFLYFIDNNMVIYKIALVVRGWGHLTGTGTLNLDQSTTADIQDGFLNWVCDQLNENCGTTTGCPVECLLYDKDDLEHNLNVQIDEYLGIISRR